MISSHSSLRAGVLEWPESSGIVHGSGMSDWAIHALCSTFGGAGHLESNSSLGDSSLVSCTSDGLVDDLTAINGDACQLPVPSAPAATIIVAPVGLSGKTLLRFCRLPLSSLLQSAKAAYLSRELPALVSAGHHILLFSSWTTTLDILEALLNWLGITWLRLDGSTPVVDRQRLIDLFNSGCAPVFLLSTRAGGLGLNLTRADTVFM
jgi:SNF2 family DNA or RNA helicase